MKKITLKNLMAGIGIILLGSFANAQNGLENVIVERYYVADANDTTFSGANGDGTLAFGSVTYRIFVDMLPGYKFEALYGVPTPDLHLLSITTTTSFFNAVDRGGTTPTYSKTQASHNTNSIDSWFSAGAACANQWGVLKSEDDGVSNVVNTDGILQNNDPLAGIPLTTQDGMIAPVGTHTPGAVTFVGITNGSNNNDLSILDATSQIGNNFNTDNGSIACLNGVYGPDSLTNKVLIGQFTTDGVFCFELNIQIGTPSSGVENYVAQNPTGNEIQLSCLTYCSNTTLGINNPPPSSSTSISVYPNPSSDFVTIDISSSSKSNSYMIYDIIGNVIANKELGIISGKYSEHVDLSSLAKGIYFIEFTLDGVKSTKKIIKD